MPPAPARSIVDAHERAVPRPRRRSDGVHYTPAELAGRIVAAAFALADQPPSTVLDPSCGAGAMLLAAADALAGQGVEPAEVVTRRLRGADVDPDAVLATRRALATWASAHGATVRTDDIAVVVADALAQGPTGQRTEPADVVVGNPPFLSQLASDTARDAATRERVRARFGRRGAYADTASLHLLAALDSVRAGGIVAMVQPRSFLATRDSGWIRDELRAGGEVLGLWSTDDQPFDAAVTVCVPVLRRRSDRGGVDTAVSEARGPVRLWWGAGWETRPAVAMPTGSSWAPLLAPSCGVPDVSMVGSGTAASNLAAPDPASAGPATLGSVANTTAGFRDEYYALCAAIVEDPSAPAAPGRDGPWPLVSVGMIDPAHLRRGEAEHRVAGRRRRAPVVDPARLAAESATVARWVADRRRPKVLVATQTRVLEAVADPGGELVPLTPTISVEPRRGAPGVWHLCAALLAPPLSALVASELLGSGRSAGALRLSARSVAALPLPRDAALWDRGAEIAEAIGTDTGTGAAASPGAACDPARRDRLLGELAVTMTRAHGLDGAHPVVGWWHDRRPHR